MAITAKFEADFSQFKDAVASADTSLKGIEASTKTFGAAMLTALASHEIRRFATDVSTAANEFVGAFAEEETAVKKLQTALDAQGTTGAMEQYRALATQFQNTTRFSDDLVTSMEAMLVQVGNILPKDMEAALTASANLATGLGIPLQTATMLVAKAFGQGGEQLGKLKALLGDTVPKGADMAQVMEAINAKFGGQAASDLDTYAGRMAQVNNKISDFKEKVGELLVTGLTPLLNAFGNLPQSAQTVIIGIVAVGAALAPVALSFVSLSAVITPLITALGATGLVGALGALVPFLGPVGIIAAGIAAWYVVFKNLDVFVWAAKASWDALKAAFAAAAVAISNSAQAVYEGVKTWLVDRFRGIVDAVTGYVNYIIGLWNSMKATVGGAIGLGSASAAPAARAGGGPVLAGSSYLVGERGPELFTPSVSGSITPHGGGGSAVINVFVNGTGADVARQMVEELTRLMQQGRLWPA